MRREHVVERAAEERGLDNARRNLCVDVPGQQKDQRLVEWNVEADQIAEAFSDAARESSERVHRGGRGPRASLVEPDGMRVMKQRDDGLDPE